MEDPIFHLSAMFAKLPQARVFIYHFPLHIASPMFDALYRIPLLITLDLPTH